MNLSASNRTLIAIFVLVAAAIAFWMLLISPKKDEANKVAEEVTQLESTLAQTNARVEEGEQAHKEFAHDYQQLVVLGKAVPDGDETSSLLVQLNKIADSSGVTFESLKVGASDSSEEAVPASEEVVPPAGEESEAPEGEESEAAPEESESVPTAAATESSASLQPIGALVGPAGLSVLPYDIAFKGNFFQVANFIRGIDSLIHTKGDSVAVDGRLVTLNGFSLAGDADKGFPHLNASFSVTTYLVPPGQGLTAGATTTEPGVIEATASATETGYE